MGPFDPRGIVGQHRSCCVWNPAHPVLPTHGSQGMTPLLRQASSWGTHFPSDGPLEDLLDFPQTSQGSKTLHPTVVPSGSYARGLAGPLVSPSSLYISVHKHSPNKLLAQVTLSWHLALGRPSVNTGKFFFFNLQHDSERLQLHTKPREMIENPLC